MTSTAHDDRAQVGPTARDRERDARRRYQATIAAAIESLRCAEQRFYESSASIDVHIQRACAASADRGIARLLELSASGASPEQSKSSAAGRSRSPRPTRAAPERGAKTAPADAGRPTLSPVPSRAMS